MRPSKTGHPPCAACGSTTELRAPVETPYAPDFVRGKVVCQACCRSGLSEQQVEANILSNMQREAN